MPQTVQIEGYGDVEFPDDFTEEDISSAVKTNVLPRLKRRSADVAAQAEARGEGDLQAAMARGAGHDIATLRSAQALINFGFSPRKQWGLITGQRSIPDTLREFIPTSEPEAVERTLQESGEPIAQIPEGVAGRVAVGAVTGGLPVPDKLKQLIYGAGEEGARMAEGLTSPSGLATLPAFGTRAAGPLLVGMGGKELYEGGKAALEAENPEQLGRALVRGGVGGTMALAGAAHFLPKRGGRPGTPPPLPGEQPGGIPPGGENEAAKVLEILQKGEDAVQEPGAEGGVLPPPRPEVELPGMGPSDAGPEAPPGTPPPKPPAPAPPEAPVQGKAPGENVLPPLRPEETVTVNTPERVSLFQSIMDDESAPLELRKRARLAERGELSQAEAQKVIDDHRAHVRNQQLSGQGEAGVVEPEVPKPEAPADRWPELKALLEEHGRDTKGLSPFADPAETAEAISSIKELGGPMARMVWTKLQKGVKASPEVEAIRKRVESDPLTAVDLSPQDFKSFSLQEGGQTAASHRAAASFFSGSQYPEVRLESIMKAWKKATQKQKQLLRNKKTAAQAGEYNAPQFYQELVQAATKTGGNADALPEATLDIHKPEIRRLLDKGVRDGLITWEIPEEKLPPPWPVNEPTPTTKRATTAELKEQKDYLLKEIDKAIAEGKEGEATIISVPGDGVFKFYDLKKARERVAKEFPTAGTTPGKSTAPGRTISKGKTVGALKTPKTQEEVFKAIDDVVSNDERRFALGAIYSDGNSVIASDGRTAVRVDSKAPEGIYPRRPFAKDATPESSGNVVAAMRRYFADADNAEPVAKGVDTARLGALANQAMATFSGSDKLPFTKILVNPDGSLGLSATDKASGDVYTHNVLEGAREVGEFDAGYLADIARTARALGHEKVDLRVIPGTDDVASVLVADAPGYRQIVMGAKEAKPEASAAPEEAPPEPPPSATEGYRREGSAPEGDIFDFSESELRDLFGERKPRPAGEAAKSNRWVFRNYNEFRDWMDARYTERDLESMREAFTDVDSPFKIRYIKENKEAAEHKKAWIRHMATGSDIPAEDPPVPRTQMPPGPGGRKGPERPPARPAEPPPPPREPTTRAPFDIQALVQFLRAFGNYPRVNQLMRDAYGRYMRLTKQVELMKNLTWDLPFATRVLSHEIGHFIDLALGPEGLGKSFAQKWQPLKYFKKGISEDPRLREEAKKLSAVWRGPFSPSDRYRNSSNELFADAMSAILTKPELVNKDYPLLHDTFEDLLQGKPAFKAAYDDLTSFLHGGRLVEHAAGQLEKSFRGSIKEFAEMEPPEKMAYTDAFRKAMVSRWFRVGDIEGKHPIGDRIIDKVEDSSLLSMKMGKVAADEFKRNVQPNLDKIQGGGEKARSLFSQWLFANRIINERRPAAQWIEQNPVEAHELLQAIVDKLPNIRSKYLGEIQALQGNGSGAQYYDLAGRMFRQIIQDGPDSVRRAQRVISEIADEYGADLSGAMQAFNVRGRLLNPSGFTEERARQLVARILHRLSPEERDALARATDSFFDIMQTAMEAAHDADLISDRNWKQLVQPNMRNYVPFAVLDYWDQRVGAGIRNQAGTVKDIADPVLAAQLKMGSIFNWIQRQEQVKLLMDAYARGGYLIGPGERLRGLGALEAIRKRHVHDSTSRMVTWVDGQARLVEFPDDVGKTLEHASERPTFLNDLYRWMNGPLGRLSRGILSTYTTLAPGFLFFRNLIRDAQTSAQRVGYTAAVRQTLQGLGPSAKMAANYARSAFGEPLMPEVERLIANGSLPPAEFSRSMYSDKAMLEQLLVNGGVTAMEVSSHRPQEGPVARALGPVYRKAQQWSSALEALPKIQTYYAGRLRNLDEPTAAALARRAGIPNPTVGGTYSGFIEAFLPWTRVHVQGIRSTIDVAKDPNLGHAFLSRVLAVEMAPRLARFAIASKIINNSLRPENENDTSWQASMGEFFRRASPYKMGLDNLIPIGWRDPRTDTFYPLNYTFGKKASEIPTHWEAVSFRLPSSEEGKLWGSLFYGMISGMDPSTSRAGKDSLGNMREWLYSQGVPQVAPGLEIVKHQIDLTAGINPQDSFRGQPVANEELYQAGGEYRNQAQVGALFNELGDVGATAGLISQYLGLIDPRAVSASSVSADKPTLMSQLPIARSALAFDNYAQYRDRRQADIDEKMFGARARLMMSDDVRTLYTFYTRNLDRSVQEKMDPVDRVRFAAAKNWHSYVWGNRDEPNRMYSRALHAVGRDGTKDAERTVKQDLEAASKPFVDAFKMAPQIAEKGQ